MSVDLLKTGDDEGRGRGKLQHMATIDLGSLRWVTGAGAAGAEGESVAGEIKTLGKKKSHHSNYIFFTIFFSYSYSKA